MTHIRRCIETSLAICGVPKPVSSISYEHWLERKAAPQIDGHIKALPGGLCEDCRQTLEALGV